jgi:opacity protein-like surface antigen
MKKISTLFAAACLASSVANAAAITQTAPAHPQFNGFYAGAGFGILHLAANDKIKKLIQKITTPNPPQQTYAFETDEGHHAFSGNLFVGYGRKVKPHLYLGGELFAQHSPITVESQLIETSISPSPPPIFILASFRHEIELNYSYGALLRGGYVTPSQFLFYGLAGYERGHVDTTETITLKSDDFSPTIPTQTKTRHSNQNGLILGLGLEGYLTPKLSVRTQYAYTLYKKLAYTNKYTFSSENPDIDFHITLDETHINHLKQGVFSLDFLFHFG